MGGFAHLEARLTYASRGATRCYRTYGLLVRSVLPLPGREVAESSNVEVELLSGSASFFSRAQRLAGIGSDDGEWFAHARLPDGSHYLRWSGLFEFQVSPEGRRIICRALNGNSGETFHTYLLGQVLSFALVNRGLEPLHSTAVVIDGEAVAFLGDCGFGKSSLGATFLQAGNRLLTDDLLVLEAKADAFMAQPGPPRIKLFPKVAKAVFGDHPVGERMSRLTPKRVFTLDRRQTVLGSVPLRAIYVLRDSNSRSRGQAISIRPLSQRAAFLELIKNTFNRLIVEPDRLRRQFDLATRVVAEVPVAALSYPRVLGRLPDVRRTILTDLSNGACLGSH